MKRVEEAKRWFAQALRDLKAANDSLSCGNFEWSCFQAQQAAEKAVKALLFAHGRKPWGHSIVELLEELRSLEQISDDLFVYARELVDTTYRQDIQTRLSLDILACTMTSLLLEEQLSMREV